MSAMSASPVKPVLPPTGVNVPPPVATSPSKVGMIQIPPSLTIAPSKSTNMNHTAMPLSLIADHKLQQPQTGIPVSSMQPLSQPLPRTPEKPKEIPVPATLPMKPTANGMEVPIATNQNPVASPALPEPNTAKVAATPQKVETSPEMSASNVPVMPESVSAAEPPVTVAALPVEPGGAEKKEEAQCVKLAELATEGNVPRSSATLEPIKAVVPNPPSSTAGAPATAAAVPSPSLTSASMPTSNPIPALTTASSILPPAHVPTPTAASTPTPSLPSAPPPLPVSTTQPPVLSEQTSVSVPAPSVTPSVSRSEASVPHPKPELKVATIPRQAAKRKREPKVEPKKPEIKKEGKDDDRKSKRLRLPTQPYQSPIPELNIIAKINKTTKSIPSKAADDKLIVFYKNEFLAVRNADGGFYVCQAMQNIYKSSPRIRIRWLSLEEGKDTYSPDFYDHTDFDCILTNLNLEKVDKDKFRLPELEQQRTESILKRALDVEKGVSEKPPVTEEHPDGLDLSLFRDESQLKKSKGRERKSDSKSEGSNSADDVNSEDDEEDEKDESKLKQESAPKTNKRKKKSSKKKPLPAVKKPTFTKSVISSIKSSVQPVKKTEMRVSSKRKLSVSSNSQPLEKRVRKPESSQPSDRTNKTRSVEVVAVTKSRRDRQSKSRK